MFPNPTRIFCGILALAATILPASGQSLPEKGVALLHQRCAQCHGGSVSMSELKLNSREAVLQGGTRGPAVQPGDAKASRLFQFVSHAAEPMMPPTGRLADDEIQILQQWIDEGFQWPEATATARLSASSDFWAFRKPSKPDLPNRQGKENLIDVLVEAKLEEQGLEAAPQADRRTLLRRAYFDLHGLPPSPEEVRAFLGDDQPDAWARLIDRLLDSPRYGEKWGRHWLDLVRYGDTAGFETDPYHLDAWRFRDYVIKSFNDDKPYDRFIKEQLAGDEIWPDDPDAGVATGYFRVGPHRDLQVKIEEQNRVEKLSDYVDTTSRVFLGLTVGCARCHDHKFDPIPQRDYYRMQAIFEPAVNAPHMIQPLALLSEVNKTKREFKLYQIGQQLADLYAPYEKRLRREKLAGLGPEVIEAFETPADDRTAEQQVLVTEHADRARVTDPEIRDAMAAGDRERLEEVERRLVSIFRGYGPPPFSDGIKDAGGAWQPSFVWLRGDPGSPGEQVTPGFISALGGGDIPAPDPHAKTTGRRKALAEWIASADNPLTSRVMVNRIWQYYFGRGLVATPSDFGTRSQAPSHPELLDWLAVKFVENGWSVKGMHRLMMNSRVYRRSSQASPQASQNDPENVYLSHMSRRRLTAEEVRDAVLAVSGSLNLEMGGVPAVPPLDEEELFGIIGKPEDAWVVTPDPEQHNRRSIYLLSRRTFIQPMFAAFDQPDGVASCSGRNESTTAPQSLTLMNSRFMVEQSRLLAAKAPTMDDVWWRVLGRDPNDEEKQSAGQFLEKQTALQGSAEEARGELARALLNLNEFLYVD